MEINGRIFKKFSSWLVSRAYAYVTNTCMCLCPAEDCAGYLDMHGQTGRILIDQPAIWTENEGGFQTWGGSAKKPLAYFWGRSVVAHAFSVMR